MRTRRTTFVPDARCRRPPALQPLEPRTLLNGVTIITHGYQPFSNSAPNWISTMKDAVVARLGPDTTVYKMKLDNSNSVPYVSSFTRIAGPAPNSPASSKSEAVLLIDWAADSGVIFSFYATSRIATLIVPYLTTSITWPDSTITPALAEGPVQLIGHSRGASLISEIAKDLGQSGIWVDQLTTLDPHPVSSDPSVNLGSNIIFADNYYETADLTPGSPVTGAYNLNLTSVDPSHSGIHAWYHGTIDLNATSDGDGINISPSWYGSNPRNATGFFFSRIAGGTRPISGISTAFGGTGVRNSITRSGNQWANIAMVTPSTNILNEGQSFTVNYRFQDADSSANLQWFLDTNQNPYDNNAIPLGNLIPLVSTGETVQSNISSLTAPSTAGTYYLYGRVSDGTSTRYAYAPSTLTLLEPPPSVTALYASSTSWTSPFLNYLATSNQGSATLGYRITDTNSLPWSTLNQLSITLSQNVTLTQSNFQLTGLNIPSYTIQSFSYNPSTFTATLTLANPLPADRLTLSIPSLNLTQNLNVLPGDINRDNIVDGADFDTLFTHLLTTTYASTSGDLNADGLVDGADFDLWFSHLLSSLPSTSNNSVSTQNAIALTTTSSSLVTSLNAPDSDSLSDNLRKKNRPKIQKSPLHPSPSAHATIR